MIEKYSPSVKDIVVGNLFVHDYHRHITVVIIERLDCGLKVFTSTGKNTFWGLESFRSAYRRVV